VDRSDELVPCLEVILTGIFPLLSFSTSRTPLNFYWFIMSCCVFFLRISPNILAFSAHFFSFHDILCVFLYSFKFLCFLKYWNICWLEYFREILCMKILFCLCVGLILIYLGILVCYICLCNFCIQLKTVIIPHCFLNLQDLIFLVVVFLWRYFCLNLYKNMSSSGSQHNIWQMDPLENK
jgi:hypothetical protein